MKDVSEMSVNEIKNKLWHLSEGRMVGVDSEALRSELYRRTGALLGYHEHEYKNEDQACECWKCEYAILCVHKDAFRRLPKTVGGLGACPKLA